MEVETSGLAGDKRMTLFAYMLVFSIYSFVFTLCGGV